MMIYDAKAKKKVSNDWAAQFPLLQVWKATRLLKRHGPLVVGICLDRASSMKYTPIAHFHTLCIPFPTISLSLAGELEDRGVPLSISLSRHELEYQRVVAEFRLRYSFLDNERMEFNDFVNATRDYISGKHGKFSETPYQHPPFEGIISVAAYLGQINYAQLALDDFARRISRWPSSAVHIIGSADKWRAKMQEIIDAACDSQHIVDNQINEHKLDGIPDYGLIWSASPKSLP
ncbi:MAG: hypothetical protein SFY80_03725 [Verrucomicrobiota bacterium]|nr:hypothetical protein [Verrucomicrobiota bacterium]